MADVSSSELNPHVEAFFAYMARRRKSAKTIERWRPELRRFVEWVGDRPLSAITGRELEFGFLTAWEAAFRDRNGRDPSPNSLRAVVQALTSFYAFLDRFELLVDAEGKPLRNPTVVLDAPSIKPAAELDWLHAEDDEAFLAAEMNQREEIIVYFLRLTGLRVSEALGLLNRDVDLTRLVVQVRSSKSDSGYRSVPITPELAPKLSAWLAYTKANGWYASDGPFLVTKHATPMKPQYVETVVARVGARAGLARKVTPHTLRRTFGSDLLNRGARLEVVSKLLGHASTQITEKSYARLEDATIRAEMLRALGA